MRTDVVDFAATRRKRPVVVEERDLVHKERRGEKDGHDDESARKGDENGGRVGRVVYARRGRREETSTDGKGEKEGCGCW